ncbi:MAG: UMP kinase [Candidatus Magasanikbacteria bacterium]|jgi:uridylate kinase
MKDKNKIVVLSLGGSLIVPKTGFDLDFIKNFKSFILKQIKNGFKFVIVCGGGNTARVYQAAAREVGNLLSDDIDWIGIHATRLNAHFIRTIFREWAHPIVVKNPTVKLQWKKPLLIAAGWKPGWSTDYDAVKLATMYGASTVVNLSNIEYVYDKDPNKFKDAKKIEKISWKDFRKIVGNKWVPGANLPFDPIASREAQKHKIKVAVIKGDSFEEMENVLTGKQFKGTFIY